MTVFTHSVCSFSAFYSKGGERGGPAPRREARKVSIPKLKREEIDMINEDWDNTEMTTLMWEVISRGDYNELAGLLEEQPGLAHIRSEDGRGPMWWAYEFGRTKMIDLLKQAGVSEERTDRNGLRPPEVRRK